MDLGRSYFLAVQCRVLVWGRGWQSQGYSKLERKVVCWNLRGVFWSCSIIWWFKVDNCGQAPGHCILGVVYIDLRSYLHNYRPTRSHCHWHNLLQTSCPPTIKRRQDDIQVTSPYLGIDSLRLCRQHPMPHESRPLKSRPQTMRKPSNAFHLGFIFLVCHLGPRLRRPSAALWKENDDLGRRHGNPNEQGRGNAFHALRNRRHHHPAPLCQH
mmetsp:Transcript_14351/g.26413  ORF Transcript_14351/g.26413 Transcript_14351/m.26413 type:complete len:212 (+) Transcript_14351:600-1235(+)